MVNLKGKSISKLLLIITMVIQPVMFSYAMASMDHSHQAPSSLAHEQTGDHAMNEGMADTHDQNAHEGDSALDNCCNTAACSPASVMSVITVPYVPKSQYIVSAASTLRSIDLPTEIKPPRSLLG